MKRYIFHHGLKVSSQASEYHSEVTCLQSESQLWFKHHKGYVTSSQFGAVFRTKRNSSLWSLIKKIILQNKMPKSAALDWGKAHDFQARREHVSAAGESILHSKRR